MTQQPLHVAATSYSAPLEDVNSRINEISQTELQQVAKACLAYLGSHLDPTNPTGSSGTNKSIGAADHGFMAYLVTATLCFGLAPRSQVLKQLQIGTSFTKQSSASSSSCYVVKLLAEMSKNGKPTMFTIPEQLTPAFDYYLHTVRPRLTHNIEPSHAYVFVKRRGTAPRSDSSSLTCLATMQILGRPVNAHAFRSAIITTFYESGASQSEMDVLATIMAHDPSSFTFVRSSPPLPSTPIAECCSRLAWPLRRPL
jgi:hypothetical protein